MAKWSGVIGYALQKKTASGVLREVVEEHKYRGDVVTDVRRWQNGEGLNDDLQIQNQLSVVADTFAFLNVNHIRYVTYMGAKWKVRSIQIQRPRLVLSIGDVYNEQNAGTTSSSP